MEKEKISQIFQKIKTTLIKEGFPVQRVSLKITNGKCSYFTTKGLVIAIAPEAIIRTYQENKCFLELVSVAKKVFKLDSIFIPVNNINEAIILTLAHEFSHAISDIEYYGFRGKGLDLYKKRYKPHGKLFIKNYKKVLKALVKHNILPLKIGKFSFYFDNSNLPNKYEVLSSFKN